MDQTKHQRKIYGANFTPAELMRLRCMWTMGVPVHIVSENLNRLTERSAGNAVRKRRWFRPAWFRSMINATNVAHRRTNPVKKPSVREPADEAE